jgi:hypothetical protein
MMHHSSRRHFLKTSLTAGAATTVAGLSAAPARAASASGRGADYFELRAYRLKAGDAGTLLHAYLEKAFIPALNSRGIANVGVFTELDVDKQAVTAKPKQDTPVWVLIAHPTLESFVSVSADLNTDPTVQKNGAAYLEVKKATPAFERVDSWLLRGFSGMPRLAVPAFSKNKTPTRVFEMRDYESHSELRALSKMAMFNAGEIEVMKDLGMSPVFFGQALAGPNLPHLRYITCAVDLATHLNNWKKFGPDPRWTKLKQDPQYTDNTSKNTARFVAPTAYSQI